jgi:hypothetical protein
MPIRYINVEEIYNGMFMLLTKRVTIVLYPPLPVWWLKGLDPLATLSLVHRSHLVFFIGSRKSWKICSHQMYSPYVKSLTLDYNRS